MKTPSEILKKIKFMELKLKRRSLSFFTGGRASVFKGEGMIFSDYRKYVPGDDVRSINWPLTARKGSPYIKLFESERSAEFLLLVDVSASMDFGAQSFKGETASELASLIALSARQNQDSIGLLLFSNCVEHYVPPARNPEQAFRLIKDLYSFKRKFVKSDIGPALSFLRNVLKKRCCIFLLSDFLMPSHFIKPLQQTNIRHEVLAGIVQDPFDKEFFSMGLMDLQDPETGRRFRVDTSSKTFLKQYKTQGMARNKKLENYLVKSNTEFFYLNTRKDIFKQFISFINKRPAR